MTLAKAYDSNSEKPGQFGKALGCAHEAGGERVHRGLLDIQIKHRL